MDKCFKIEEEMNLNGSNEENVSSKLIEPSIDSKFSTITTFRENDEEIKK